MLMQERENSIALLGTETAMTLPTKLLRPAAAVARHYLSHPVTWRSLSRTAGKGLAARLGQFLVSIKYKSKTLISSCFFL